MLFTAQRISFNLQLSMAKATEMIKQLDSQLNNIIGYFEIKKRATLMTINKPNDRFQEIK